MKIGMRGSVLAMQNRVAQTSKNFTARKTRTSRQQTNKPYAGKESLYFDANGKRIPTPDYKPTPRVVPWSEMVAITMNAFASSALLGLETKNTAETQAEFV